LTAEGGLQEEAARELEGLIAKQPGNAKLLALAGDINFKESPEKAVEYYRQAVQAAPADNRTRVQLGAALVRSKRFADAVSVLIESLNRENENYQARANLATALFELKQYPQAAGQFLWLIRVRPDLAPAYYFLAISFDKMSDCKQALQSYRQFLAKAEPAANKREIEDATIRVSLLEKLEKTGKCKSTTTQKRG
jgi:predicted Zn-dependent protease